MFLFIGFMLVSAVTFSLVSLLKMLREPYNNSVVIVVTTATFILSLGLSYLLAVVRSSVFDPDVKNALKADKMLKAGMSKVKEQSVEIGAVGPTVNFEELDAATAAVEEGATRDRMGKNEGA